METLVTLKDFNAEEQHFYIHRISKSKVSDKYHYHSFYQLCFVENGKIEHIQGDKPIVLKKGDVFLIPPNFVHCIKFLDKDSYIYSLLFDENLFLRQYFANKRVSLFNKPTCAKLGRSTIRNDENSAKRAKEKRNKRLA